MAALLTIQTFGFGCAAVVTVMYCVLILVAALATGLQYLLLVVAGLGLATALSAVAVGLWILAKKSRRGLHRWTVIVLAVEAVFTPVGSILVGLESRPGPTEGPFADGGNGVIGLLGFILVACGSVALIVLAWELVVDLGGRALRRARG